MCAKRWEICAITRLITIISVLNFVRSLTIDNQLTVIRNDCYERLAIGEKLNRKDVDKTLTLNTVQDCQMACTQEQEKCRSFSFGIGMKGNATCELSKTVIKETPDLKPIGTVSDVEFDLYIKKLGCKLVVPKDPASNNVQPSSENSSPYNQGKPQEKPSYPTKPSDDYGPSNSPDRNHNYKEPPYYGPARPTYAPGRPYQEGPPGPIYASDRPYRVQSSFISVASNPNPPPQPPASDSERPYRPSGYGTGRPYYPNRFSRPDFDRPPSYYDFRGDRPPFRPPFLNHPYDDNRRPPPEWYDREPHYAPDRRPSNDRLDLGLYGPGSRPNRPDNIPERPVGEHYGQRPVNRPDSIPEPPFTYGNRPSRPPFVPERPYPDDRPPFKPRPERPLEDSDIYGQGSRPQRPSEIPERPVGDSHFYGHGERPHRPQQIPERPLGDSGVYESRPQRPGVIPERPLSDSDAYGSRPDRPHEVPQRPLTDDYGQGNRPQRPHEIPERPFGDSGIYEFRPQRPDIIPQRPLSDSSDYGSRPNRPLEIPQRPLGDDYGQGNRPHRPHDIPERPNRPFGDSNSYGQGSRPHRPHDIPERPLGDFDDYGSRPHRPDWPSNFYGTRPQRPQEIPSRPLDDAGSYGSRPHRPDVIPQRPLGESQIYGHRPRPNPPHEIPERPLGVFDYDQGSRPHRPIGIPDRPLSDSDNYGSRPHRPDRIPDRPYGSGIYDYRPSHNDPAGYGPDRYRPPYVPDDGYDRPYYRPGRPRPVRPLYDEGVERPGLIPLKPIYEYGKSKPGDDTEVAQNVSQDANDSVSNTTSPSSADLQSNLIDESDGNKNPHKKPIVTETVGPYGETITSIITEINEACFRRVLAGKRVLRAFVRKTVPCERIEDCQRECSDEKRFVCEGFNYRLDPSGRGQGDCELLDIPLSRLDIRRDVYDDRDYDYYERDRNSDAPDCKGQRYYGSYGGGGGGGWGGGGGGGSAYYHSDDRYDYYDHHRHGGYYDDSYREGSYGHGHRQPRPGANDDGFRFHDSNRRGDFDYHHSYQLQDDYERSHGYHYKYHSSGSNDYDYDHSSHGYKYHKPGIAPPRDDYDYKPHYPPPPYDYKSYEPYLPYGYWKYERPFHDSGGHWDKYFEDRIKDKSYWGFHRNNHYGGWGHYGGSYGNFGAPDSYYPYDYFNDHHRNNNRHDSDFYEKKYYYVPHDKGGAKDWGRYGGSYGYDEQKWAYDNHRNGFDYWGFNRIDGRENDYGNVNTGLLPPYQEKPDLSGNYLPPYDEGYDYFGIQHHGSHDYDHYGHRGSYDYDHYGHRGHDYHDFLKDECSLRMVTGFRLHKGIVKKLVAVPNIYECELLCFNERDFPCNSYAFRYTTIPNSPPENCYLSDRDYKELDYYTDLEPDRDCDIYTMNNQDRCDQSTQFERYNSECFWRVRSGQRLDQRVVRDSLNVKSIVDCQLECLRSSTFTCRAFSFRYGPPVVGGAIDNCQLTDWPFLDMDPRIHLIPENGFELYERGSYGHGCEPNHFQIGHKPDHNTAEKLDQLCYIGYGSPARLLPQAAKKTLRVESEAECKAECTRARDKSLFQCMSLSYRTLAPKGIPNCDLSDIVQRDLLSNVDYVADPDSWLFAWDMHNPRCIAVISVIAIGTGGGSGSSGGGSGGIGGGGSGIGGGGVIIGGGRGSNGIDDHDHHGKGILIPWLNPGYTWRIYSVGGLPCKKGSLCQENKVAGFWYCELEGREEHAWDYCCRPDHQCGYSEGFPYQWCHVGPGRSQWRKCNDRYYPYTNSADDRFDHHHTGSYLPDVGHSGSQAWALSNSVGSDHASDLNPSHRPGFRPDRPSPSHFSQPTLDDYDSQFNNHFLDPPKPGGFGQSRHWPLSYLHKEMPPNDTFSDTTTDKTKAPKGRNIDSKYDAITNLINVIKSNDLKNLQYTISNTSAKSDDILYVQIPLPSNFSTDIRSEKLTKVDDIQDKLEAVDLFPNEKLNGSNKTSLRSHHGVILNVQNATDRKPRAYTRSYITKTNRTASNLRHGKSARGTVESLPLF